MKASAVWHFVMPITRTTLVEHENDEASRKEIAGVFRSEVGYILLKRPVVHLFSIDRPAGVFLKPSCKLKCSSAHITD